MGESFLDFFVGGSAELLGGADLELGLRLVGGGCGCADAEREERRRAISGWFTTTTESTKKERGAHVIDASDSIVLLASVLHTNTSRILRWSVSQLGLFRASHVPE